MMPTVEIISTWYNEAYLAPFFLRHYSWADRITIFYDRDTTDETLDIIRRYANVTVKPFRFPDKFDDLIKQRRMNLAYAESSCDWAFLLDADEYVFRAAEGELIADVRPFLALCTADVIHANFMEVNRNRHDAELDPDLPVAPQRRHGVVGDGKPCLARTGLGLRWRVGCHSLAEPVPENIRVTLNFLSCAHWSMADPCFAFKRRLRDRKGRLSKVNFERGMDSHNQSITAEALRAHVAAHLDDPKIF